MNDIRNALNIGVDYSLTVVLASIISRLIDSIKTTSLHVQ